MKQGSTLPCPHHGRLGCLASATHSAGGKLGWARYFPIGALRLSGGSVPTVLRRCRRRILERQAGGGGVAVASARPDYDQTLKRLLTAAHDGLLALLWPEARWLAAASPELPAASRQADLVWLIALPGGEQVLLHVELQTHPDPALGERLTEYALRLWRRDRLPVRSVVVYLRETAQRLPSSFVLERGGGEVAVRAQFDVVRLWAVPAEVALARPEPGIWPLAALMAGSSAALVGAVAERIAQSALPLAERGELTGLLAVLAGMRLPPGVLAQLIGRNPMFREWVRESGVAELFEPEAAARGKAEGKAEGIAAGMRELVQTQLERRFGSLQPEELAALQAADVPLLRELAAQVIDASREEIRAQLGLPPGA